jgi:hypothetical protein
MKKITCVVSCPISTYSGYGGRSRDFVKALIKTHPDWDIKILSQRWGITRMSYLEDHNEQELLSRLLPSLTYRPDVWIQITIPNEFQPVGTFNIGVTAGVETTIADPSWAEGCNRMNLVLVSSNHAKKVLTETVYSIQDSKTKQVTGDYRVTVPVEVVFEGVDLNVYRKLKPTEVSLDLSAVKEDFCFLATGHWMQGTLGHDRKNIGLTIKTFLETFKNKERLPGLILKISHGNASKVDKDQLITKINSIKAAIKGNLPNVYLVHGDLTDAEMNELYNHPKVKCLISLTKGEGYGRPFAEFALTEKPIIASGWSGHLDFLDKDSSILVSGTLEPLHPTSVIPNLLIKESSWFSPDIIEVNKFLKEVFKEYKNFLGRGTDQAKIIKNNFSFVKMEQLLGNILKQYVPNFPEQVTLTLPKLKKVNTK